MSKLIKKVFSSATNVFDSDFGAIWYLLISSSKNLQEANIWQIKILTWVWGLEIKTEYINYSSFSLNVISLVLFFQASKPS